MVTRTPDGYEIPHDVLVRWMKAYPSVNIQAEARKAFEWEEANPRRRHKNVQLYLARWMAREQEKVPIVPEPLVVERPSLPDLTHEQVVTNRQRFAELVRTVVRRMA